MKNVDGKSCLVIDFITQNTNKRAKTNELLQKPIFDALTSTNYKPQNIVYSSNISLEALSFHIKYANLVIVNLVDCNPNVVYFLAIRHATKKPTLLIEFDKKSSQLQNFVFHQSAKIKYGNNFLEDLVNVISSVDTNYKNPLETDFFDLNMIPGYFDLINLVEKLKQRMEKETTEMTLQEKEFDIIKQLIDEKNNIISNILEDNSKSVDEKIDVLKENINHISMQLNEFEITLHEVSIVFSNDGREGNAKMGKIEKISNMFLPIKYISPAMVALITKTAKNGKQWWLSSFKVDIKKLYTNGTLSGYQITKIHFEK